MKTRDHWEPLLESSGFRISDPGSLEAGRLRPHAKATMMVRQWLRLRIWMMMALVAVSAVGMGGYVKYHRLCRLSQDYKNRASFHDGLAAIYSSNLSQFEVHLVSAKREMTDAERSVGEDPIAAGTELQQSFVKKWEALVERERARMTYHAALARKYRHAASRPWLRVEPDPPEPE